MFRHHTRSLGRIARLPPPFRASRLTQIRPFSSANDGENGIKHDSGLIYPDAVNTQHNSLSTFLAHAQRTGLDENSTVFVGTHFEYIVAAALSRYGFSLKRVGGASDAGTDLLGTWTPPTTTQNFRVLVQCKAGAQRVGPNVIRELEGAFVGAPVGWRGPGVMGIMVSERPATKGVRDAMGKSRWPMAFVCCVGDGSMMQFVWNQKAEEEGLEGFSVTSRYVESTGQAELVLVRNGKTLPLLAQKD